MSRLLTVVNERKKIRSLYRAHLEDQYIAEKKKEELDAFLAKRDKLREQNPSKGKEMTAEELKTHLNNRDQVKAAQL